jgi:hypothetical protein
MRGALAHHRCCSPDAVVQCGPGPPQLAPEGFVSLASVHAELRSIPPLPAPSHHASLGRKPTSGVHFT